ncbi:lysophospholipid acyltransferase LPCAT4-like [Triplophysa dalaica]|uniref:lysophospholipid acyltransferase LPCAT4-like n=1 Tax=Triplophysa dalaica TaxID=1582913 RepID=UPI0024DF7306|nr:lysophospholipid acyltransferase LPCAT4-like [Triplophysa dalaica]
MTLSCDDGRARHPFINFVDISTALRIRGILLGWILFPIRAMLTTLFLLLMWPVARLRLAGLSEAEREVPVQGWRQWFFLPIMVFLSRAAYFCMGFLWIKVKGRQADLKEAPVLVVAPHSTFLDMLVLPVTGLPTVVSRSENIRLPVIGALLEFNQAVMVNRKDPESRKKCVSQIRERVTSDGRWPQMLMFPEGTTTNGRVLIKFKPGAFLAGVPVQPVLLHYPNNTDTVRWTWKGTTWLAALWHTLSQLYTSVTVEFLPVYTPSEEEKDNPDVYAENVQKLMANALGVPATDYVMDGRFPVRKLGGLSLPLESPALETLRLLRRHGFTDAHVEALMNTMIDSCRSGHSTVVMADHLTSLLGLTDRNTALKICSLYSKDDTVDLKHICVSVSAVSGFTSLESLLHTAFTWYDSDEDGLLSADDLSALMGVLVGVPQYDITEMYSALTSRGRPTEASLQNILMTHPVYRKLLTDCLRFNGLTTADGNHNGIVNGMNKGHKTNNHFLK